MAYADKCYVGKRVKLDLLTQDEVRQIHEATLDVIESVGRQVPLPECPRRARGARRDRRS